MSDKFQQLCLHVVVIVFILSILFLLLTVFWSSMTTYKKPVDINCSQYRIILEKYIDRVPDVCLSDYFKNQASTKEATRQDTINKVLGNGIK